MSIRSRVFWAIGLLAFCLTVTSVMLSLKQIEEEQFAALVSKSKTILSRLEAVRGYIASQAQLDDTIIRMKERFPDGNLDKESRLEVLKQVPIFASMKVGAENAEEEMYRFRIFATEPRQERNTPTPEEKKILNQFIKDPSLKEVIVREPLFVGVYRPVYLSEKQGCLNCHGDPQTSPWGNGKDILGYQMENWKDGKLHGVFGIISDLKLESVVADKRNKIINILLWALILTTVCLVASYYFLREPMNNISLVVEELKASGSEIEVVSSKISRSSQTLNQSSAEAASSVGVSLEALEKLINNTHEVTKISDQAYYLSLEGKKCALKGKADFSELKNKIEILQTQSHKMSEIIVAIDEIASQTNLLSLNASVVAAHAGGEHGKSFAVVAEEVRKLSQRSLASAKIITELIKENRELTKLELDLAYQSGESLEKIVKTVEQMADLSKESSSIQLNQVKEIESLNKFMNDLKNFTQGNVSNASESAAASVELHSQTTELARHMEILKISINGEESNKSKS